MRRLVSISVLCLAVASVAIAQSATEPSSPWSLTVAPSVSLPLISGDFSGSPLFATAWGGSLSAEYALHTSFPLSLRLGAGYSYGTFLPSENIDVPGSLNEALFLAGASTGKDLNRLLSVHGFIDGGLAYGMLASGTSAAYAAAQVGAGLGVRLSQTIAARLDVEALYKAGLYGGVGATLGLSYAVPAAGQTTQPRLLELMSISMKSVFPVLRSYYDQNPVGTAKLVNTSKQTVTNVRVNFMIKQYMDAPKECATIGSIQPGATVDVPLYALFNDNILNVTEATKVTGEVSLDYGVQVAQSRSATVLVYDRNALTWSDNRKAAAFVSDKDPWVLDLTGNFMAAVKDKRNTGLEKNLQTAIAVHEGLRAYGIGYMLSTTRPFEQAVVDPEVVDSLKYPRQTLSFKAGDCADLSVLYSSCLEAAGVETAFITIPGHIFMAVDLGMTPEQAKERSIDPRNFIIADGRAWVPIEATMRDSDFMEVWQKGAEEWRVASDKKVADFYPMHESWKTYAPMGLPADGTSVTLPSGDKVVALFSVALAKAVDSELGARIAAMGSLPDSGLQASTALNNRGVLYGKYGRLKEAESDFHAAAKAGSVSALVNLGNVALLKSDPARAYGYYQQAASQVTGSASLYINIAKAANALGKTDAANAALDSARKLDAKAADNYAQLAQVGGSGTRAAEVDGDQIGWF
jgi:tetratricopeptide (TPR) repeat protein